MLEMGKSTHLCEDESQLMWSGISSHDSDKTTGVISTSKFATLIVQLFVSLNISPKPSRSLRVSSGLLPDCFNYAAGDDRLLVAGTLR